MTRRPGEVGSSTVVLPMLLWVATLVAIAVIDVGAYLVAAARAQHAADAAALAAVGAADSQRREPPRQAAERVTGAVGARLESCLCVPGATVASVQVSVAVPGLVIPRLLDGRVEARARAVLVPADHDDP